MTMIGPYSFEDYLKAVESFHGSTAPGLLAGGFMVDLAMKRMPEGSLLNAISETHACLPDAIQLLTPCTVGNSRLKIINLGRFALSIYEKDSGEGVRVFMDAGRLECWPGIRAWLFKLKPKAEQNLERLLAEIRGAGQRLCGVQPIRVDQQYLRKKSKGPISCCIQCGEPYPLQDGPICLACQGATPYVSIPDRQPGRSMHLVLVKPQHPGRTSRGLVVNCSMCGEPYPKSDGPVCRACQGESVRVIRD